MYGYDRIHVLTYADSRMQRAQDILLRLHHEQGRNAVKVSSMTLSTKANQIQLQITLSEHAGMTCRDTPV